MPTENQILIALVLFAVAVIGALTVIAKRIPDYIDKAMAARFADDNLKREDKHADLNLQLAASGLLSDLGKGVLASVEELRKMNERQETSGGQLKTLKSDMDKINKTLETGSKPLQDIGEQVKRILAIVEEIQKSPHLSEDKAKRLDDAVAAIGTITTRLGELVIALESTKEDLLRKKQDSKPIPTIDRPNGKEQ